MKKSAPLLLLSLSFARLGLDVAAEGSNLRRHGKRDLHFLSSNSNNKEDVDVHIHNAADGRNFVTTEIEYRDEPASVGEHDIKVQHFHADDGQEFVTTEINLDEPASVGNNGVDISDMKEERDIKVQHFHADDGQEFVTTEINFDDHT